MPDIEVPDLIDHLSRVAALSESQTQQVVAEVLAYFNEDKELFIRRRHHEMQQQGLSNPVIFASLQSEVTGRLFPAGHTSERQIRRIIYG